jgi:hypothetical protein
VNTGDTVSAETVTDTILARIQALYPGPPATGSFPDPTAVTQEVLKQVGSFTAFAGPRGVAFTAAGRYSAPGSRIILSMPVKAGADGGREAGDDRRSAAPPAAEARIRELHRVLAGLNPANLEWRLLAGEVAPAFADRPDLLRRASDPAETTLFSREVYKAVLDLTDAPHTVRREAWRCFNAASQAVAAAKGRRRVSTPWSLWVAGTGTAQDVMAAPLQTIDTETVFLAHLRFLLSYSTLSTRTLHKAVDKRVTSAPGHSTLVGWLKGAKLPALLSEPVLRAIVEALADDIVGDDLGVVQHVVDEHVRSYRMLLAQRQGEALMSGPVQRALAVLAEHELQLGDTGEDRIRRETGRELRERILAELAADRAHAMPTSA